MVCFELAALSGMNISLHAKAQRKKRKARKEWCLFASFALLPLRLCVKRLGYSPTYGISAINRARLIASLHARWNAAQLPLRLRLKSLPWLVQSFLSVCTSL